MRWGHASGTRCTALFVSACVRVCVRAYVCVCVWITSGMLHMCSTSLRELTAGIRVRGVDSSWCLEKADLVQLYNRLQQVFAMPETDTTVDARANFGLMRPRPRSASVKFLNASTACSFLSTTNLFTCKLVVPASVP